MPTLSEILPFEEALHSLAARGVLPTNLTSAELQQLGAGFHRYNFTSAQTLLADLLDQYKSDVGRIINPQTVLREDGTAKTDGLNVSEARLRAKQVLQANGYSPNPGEAGTITDLSSDARINLVIKTNRDVMQGAGDFIQGNDPAVLLAFPCQELVRIEARVHQRNWSTRFRICGQVVGDVNALRVLAETGRMIARKDSKIWQALGDGADGSTDTLGRPYAPFAFRSGMGLRDRPYSESVALGLIKPGQKVASSLPADLAEIFSTPSK